MNTADRLTILAAAAVVTVSIIQGSCSTNREVAGLREVLDSRIGDVHQRISDMVREQAGTRDVLTREHDDMRGERTTEHAAISAEVRASVAELDKSVTMERAAVVEGVRAETRALIEILTRAPAPQ